MKYLCEFNHREYRIAGGIRLLDVVRQQFVPAGPEEYVPRVDGGTLGTQSGADAATGGPGARG
jgi:hypothetical protein